MWGVELYVTAQVSFQNLNNSRITVTSSWHFGKITAQIAVKT